MTAVPDKQAVRVDGDLRPPSAVETDRARALGKANQVRSARATLEADLASGHMKIEDVLGQPSPFAATAKVFDLLLALPGIGPARANRALARCRIPYAKTAAGLTDRQRLALIDQLGPAGSLHIPQSFRPVTRLERRLSSPL
jgi:hypothetical protein